MDEEPQQSEGGLARAARRELGPTALRASNDRQGFLIRLDDALRPLADPAAIQNTALQFLGEHLGVDLAIYADVEGASGAEVATIRARFHREGWHAPGEFPERYLCSSFGEAMMELRRRGRTMIVTDVAEEPFFTPEERAAWMGTGVRASITVSIVKEGRMVADFGVHSTAARTWTSQEVALVEATAQRTWASVERSRAEQALRESEAKYRTLFETMEQGFGIAEILVDDAERPIDYRMLEINPQFERLTGQSREFFLSGKTVREVAPELEGHWYDFYGNVGLTGVPAHAEIHAEAWNRWFEVSAYRTGAPEQRRVAILYSEVTARKRAEKALRESEARLSGILERLPVGVGVLDPDGRWVLRNPVFQELVPGPLPSSDEEERARWASWSADGAPIPPTEWPGVRALRGEVVTPGLDFRRLEPDGTDRWVQVGATPLLDDRREISGAVVVADDVTERKRAEEALRESEEALRQMNETLEQRVSDRTQQIRRLASQLTMAEQEERRRISHILHDDLQQVLYGIEAKVGSSLHRMEGSQDVETIDDLHAAQRWLDAAITTTRQLTVDLSPPILDHEGLVEALGWLRRQMEELHGLQIIVEAESDIRLRDEDLRVLLFQIVRELLFNVKKHAGTDRASVVIFRESDEIVILVVDRGSGFHVDGPASQPDRTGFGLFNARERLHLIGGRLNVHTNPGVGTVVTLRAPLTPAQEADRR